MFHRRSPSFCIPVALVSLALAGAASAQPGGGPPGLGPDEVEVVNEPTVNIGNTPSVEIVNIPEVEVVNTPEVDLAPRAEVRDADQAARQPVQFGCELSLADLEQVTSDTCGDPLPPGKRLVIEYYSLRLLSPQRPEVRFTVTGEDPSGSPRGLDFNLPVVDCGVVAPASNCWEGSGLVRLYHTRFNMLLFLSRRGPFTGTAQVLAKFSGYYVDVP